MKQYYFDKYNITEDAAKKRAIHKSANGITTAAVEMLGEAIIKKHHIWHDLFPGYKSVKKATSKKNQKDGIDYFIVLEDDTVINIDLKVCCGPDYSFKKDVVYKDPSCVRLVVPPEDYILNQAPIELKQNNIVTFDKRKKTDYLLFIFADQNGISYHLMDYELVLKIVKDSMRKYVRENGVAVYKNETSNYKYYRSNNKSGEYILHPVKSKRVKQ